MSEVIGHITSSLIFTFEHIHLRLKTDMKFVKNFTPPDFQAKDFTPLISLNFNSFSDKNTKNECFWKNLHHWQNIYTAGGSDGSDKLDQVYCA